MKYKSNFAKIMAMACMIPCIYACSGEPEKPAKETLYRNGPLVQIESHPEGKQGYLSNYAFSEGVASALTFEELSDIVRKCNYNTGAVMNNSGNAQMRAKRSTIAPDFNHDGKRFGEEAKRVGSWHAEFTKEGRDMDLESFTTYNNEVEYK